MSSGSGGESPVLDGTMLLGAAAPLFVVPGGVWQAAVPVGAEAVLASCVASPGFEFSDFRLE
jgi:uncharacterized protein